jgi:AcrR family transcriptional regulator
LQIYDGKKELLSEILKRVNEMPKFVAKRQNTFLRRKQIVAALRKIIIEYGSENVTVKKLAEEIGVSGGAIYRHFRSKREILLFLVNDIKEDLIGDIERAYSIKNPLESLKKIWRNLLFSIEQRKGASFLVIAEIISLGDKGLNGKIFEVFNSFLGEIKRLISEGIKAGEIRKDIDVDMAATTFFGMLQGLATIWSLDGFRPKVEINRESMWKFFLGAIKKEEDRTLAGEISIGLPFSAGVGPAKLS